MADNPFARVKKPAPARREPCDVVIFDLDDTLAHTQWRAHHLDKEKNGGKANWAVFFENCRHDPPIEAMMAHAKALVAAGAKLVFFTGRPEAQRKNTLEWLAEHGLEVLSLRMRPQRSFIPDHRLKKIWMEDLKKDGHHSVCAFDDRLDNRTVFSEFGVRSADPANAEESLALAVMAAGILSERRAAREKVSTKAPGP